MNIPGFYESLQLIMAHCVSDGRVENVQDFDPLEKLLGIALPANYKTMLMEVDGAQTQDPLHYYRFYPLKELPDRHQDIHPPKCMPFATNDSTEFAFDLRRNISTASYEVVSYPESSDDFSDVEWIAEDLEEFLWLITRRLGCRPDL